MKFQKYWKLSYFLLVTIALFYAFADWAYDDPFITYRYAENLGRGLGMVYNPGERVLSTTTPLFAILLAPLSALGVDLPSAANLISAASLAAGALFLWDIANQWKTPYAGWAALLLYPSFPLLLTPIGSETPLYLALGLGSFAFYARGKLVRAALFAGLATLTRPDGALIPVIWGIDHLLRNRGGPLSARVPWRAAITFGLVLTPWVIFSWGYFGSPLPVTLAAKQGQALLAGSQQFGAGLLALGRAYAAIPQYLLEAGLAVLGGWVVIKLADRWAPVIIWPLAYAAAYTLLQVTPYFWYFAPLAPGFVAAVGLGLQGLAEGHESKVRRYPFWVAAAALGVLALLQGSDLAQVRQRSDTRALVYQAAGEWLAENTPQEASVGSLEIGIIGFYAKRPMVDFAGLLQPETAGKFGEVTSYHESAVWAVERFQPRFLALRENDVPRLQRGYAAENCQISKIFSGSAYGHEQDLYIYDCR